MSANTKNPSVREIATVWLAGDASAKKRALAYVTDRAKVSARKRWKNLHAAMTAGDALRIEAYAAAGEDKRKAWDAVRAAEKPAPKPAAKAQARPKAKAAPKAKAKATGPDLAAAARALGLPANKANEQALAAFVSLIAKSR